MSKYDIERFKNEKIFVEVSSYDDACDFIDELENACGMGKTTVTAERFKEAYNRIGCKRYYWDKEDDRLYSANNTIPRGYIRVILAEIEVNEKPIVPPDRSALRDFLFSKI